ncbi:SWIM zinc finger family protein [Botryobacter ruber]|uniref:SWIM zinc finger family protein n=1 Tax=Botryobacter ruber TaxID=2171629 RepID=UPI0013E30C26|nr:SWIM zinc finger family protein [Botryobacter ruber]
MKFYTIHSTMLTLNNFEKQVDTTILQRGKQYFNHGNVVWLEEEEEGLWLADVEGTETYQVEVTLSGKNDITDYSCDCPYDGVVCKHVVAVLYALRDETKKPAKVQERRQQQQTARNVFDHLLATVTLQEYQKFIRRFASKNKDFKTDFELYFADKDDRIDVGEKYTDLIQKIIRKHSDHGYVDYRATHTLSREVEKLLATGDDFIRKQNYHDAFILASVVLKEMIQVAEYTDDSSGNIGSTISSAIQLITDVATSDLAAPDLKEEIFAFLKNEVVDRKYAAFGDYGTDMFDMLQELAKELHKEREFLVFLDTRIAALNGYYDSYLKEYYQKARIAFLTDTGRADEAAEMLQQSLEIVELRQGEVEKAIKAKDYAEAKKLITEGIAIAKSKDHPGTVSQWERELLRIAYLEQDTATIRHYTYQFAFDRGFHEEYYKQWKATFPPYEWKAVIDKLISEKKKKITSAWEAQKNSFFKSPHPNLLPELAPLYIQEGYWDKLLVLVQKENRLDTTLRYHQYLASRYPAELLEMYLPAFAASGAAAEGRSAYARLAGQMKRVMQDIPQGKEQVKQVARNLQEQFPRRRAMIEELNKLL